MRARAPNGLEIVGTSETILGTAWLADDSFARAESGEVVYDYSGETEVAWDTQETVKRDGETVFVDEEGGEWLESEIELVSGEETGQ